MKEIDEKFIEEIISRLKANGDVSDFKKNRKISGFVTLLSRLNEMPKNSVPALDQTRVRNQILDRMNLPQEVKAQSAWFGFSVGQLLRMGAGALASLLIVASLTLGTAVAALDSVPGQAIYPLKKVVEKIELKLASRDQQADLQIKFANNRVEELQQVLQAQATGEISVTKAQKIVAATVKDLQKTTKAAVKSADDESSEDIANKLADISNQLRIASIQTEGQVKIDLEQAAEDIEQNASGPAPSSVSATGKLTAVNKTSVSIGTARFLIDENTEYINIDASDLEVDQLVSIQGVVADNNKTYAETITLIAESKSTDEDPPDESTDVEAEEGQVQINTTIEGTAPDTTGEPQQAQ